MPGLTRFVIRGQYRSKVRAIRTRLQYLLDYNVKKPHYALLDTIQMGYVTALLTQLESRLEATEFR